MNNGLFILLIWWYKYYMKKKLRSIKKSKFIRNVLIVMSGTALAQLITFVLMPIITRLYGPDAIGVLGTFTAIVAILGPVASLTYPIAIVLPKNNYQARSVVKLAIFITCVVFALLVIVLIVAQDKITSIFRLELISNFIFLLPLFVLLTGISQVMRQWLIRTKQFKITAKTSIYQALFTNLTKIGGGLIYPLSATLIVIQTIGLAFQSTLMYFLSDRSVWKRNERHSFQDIKSAAINHRDFPIFRAPQVFINAVSQGLPIILLASFFGPAVAGFYSLGKQSLDTPVKLIGSAVQDVFYPKVNEDALKRRKITSSILKAVMGLALIGTIPFGIIIIFGPPIFSLVFGVDWYTAGEYARWIAIVAYAMLITRPIIVSIPVLNIQKQFLLVEILGTIGKTGAVVVGANFFGSAIHTVAFFSIASVLMYVYLTFYTLINAIKFDKQNLQKAPLL